MEAKQHVRVAKVARPGKGWYPVPGLRAARVRRDVSQRELAGMCGVSYANISRLESGRQKAQGETVIKLAEALGAQWRELLREPLRPLEEHTMD